jgi:hypothetical protein
MADDIFISYSRRDSDFVKQLYAKLVAKGISTWFDKENIEVADHWRTSIVEGIRDCKIFVLVQSPDSFDSTNVRKEVDLAERYKRPIVPLAWRQADTPVAFEYQLAGLQYINFRENASEENFDQLAEVLQRLMGGASLDDATTGVKAVAPPAVAAIDKPATQAAPATDAGGERKLGGGRRIGGGRTIGRPKASLSAISLGYRIISSVVTTSFELSQEDQDFVGQELKWLFAASDNLLKIRDGDADPTSPVPIPLPEEASREEWADNKVRPVSGIAKAQGDQVEDILKRIDKYHITEMNTLLDQEARRGQGGRDDTELQRRIKGERVEIVKKVKEIAQVIDGAYGVLAVSPQQLLELIEEH